MDTVCCYSPLYKEHRLRPKELRTLHFLRKKDNPFVRDHVSIIRIVHCSPSLNNIHVLADY